MLFDHCTWDDDYKRITQDIRAHLLRLAHVAPERYTAVLMQGSGTFGNESVLTSVVGDDERVLVCANGAYGDRLAEICRQAGVPVTVYAEPYDTPVDAPRIAAHLAADPSITHVAMVHNETTSGLVNDIEAAGAVAKRAGAAFIVDAMSSFGGIDIPVEDWGIDFIVSWREQNHQGCPASPSPSAVARPAGRQPRQGAQPVRSTWRPVADHGRDGGKWRFTSPTNAVLAFAQAMRELEEEGGVSAQAARAENNRLLIERMRWASKPYLTGTGGIIITFAHPADAAFTFHEMYDCVKRAGTSSTGKLTDGDTFRIGTIGEITRRTSSA